MCINFILIHNKMYVFKYLDKKDFNREDIYAFLVYASISIYEMPY